MRQALLVHLLLDPFESRLATKSATLKAECSSADHYRFVASKSRCGLEETLCEPQSSFCQLWCWLLQASWGQAAGGVGVLCPVCSSVSLTCFGSRVSALRPNLLLPLQNNSIIQCRSLKLFRSLPAVMDEIKLIKSKEALSMCHLEDALN